LHRAGRGIENITFKDITYDGTHADQSVIAGYDDTRMIKNVVFENLVINGQVISDKMTKPGWFLTSDMARFFVGEHVEGMSSANEFFQVVPGSRGNFAFAVIVFCPAFALASAAKEHGKGQNSAGRVAAQDQRRIGGDDYIWSSEVTSLLASDHSCYLSRLHVVIARSKLCRYR